MPGSYNQFPLNVPFAFLTSRSSQDKLVYVFWLDVVMAPVVPELQDQVLAVPYYSTVPQGAVVQHDLWFTVSLPGCSQLE